MNKLSLIKLDIWFKSLFLSIKDLYEGDFENAGDTALHKTLGDLLSSNYKIWRYEDDARRRDVPDEKIAGLKRNIDKENQRRNDLIDSIDTILRSNIEKNVKFGKNLPLNSETPGSIFDRLIILALRAYNLKKEAERKDADRSHIKRCADMLKEVSERSKDLVECLNKLLEDYYSGKKRLKSYKQHKLYNDPDLNPSLRKPR